MPQNPYSDWQTVYADEVNERSKYPAAKSNDADVFGAASRTGAYVTVPARVAAGNDSA